MIRLRISLFVGFTAISLVATTLTCSNHELLCGNICTPYNTMCNCGEDSFQMNGNDFICISDTNCTVESGGNSKISIKRYTKPMVAKK